jgi:hypothetical protein
MVDSKIPKSVMPMTPALKFGPIRLRERYWCNARTESADGTQGTFDGPVTVVKETGLACRASSSKPGDFSGSIPLPSEYMVLVEVRTDKGETYTVESGQLFPLPESHSGT